MHIAAASRTNSQTSHAQYAVRSSNPRRTVLVVDDSIVLRSVLRTELMGQNFDVLSARDGAEAMSLLDSRPDIDLVVTDFHMPGLDGACLTERIRAHQIYHAVPVLVLTAGADESEKCRARKAGASGWVIKPFDVVKLAAAIHTLVPVRSHTRGRDADIDQKQDVAVDRTTIRRKGMLKVRYDSADGLIHTVVQGATDRDGVERYIYALLPLIEQARADWGRYWHLVDASQLELQSSEALNSLSGVSIENMEPTDRTAVVMTSDAAIKQMESMPSQILSRVFRDTSRAKEWILSGA